MVRKREVGFRMVGFGMAMLFAGAVVAADKAADKPADKPAEKAAGKQDKKDKKEEDAAAATPIDKVKWGEADGKEVSLFTLRNKNGLAAKISSYGAILVELQVPDKKGKLGDIVVGYDNLADFIKKTPYFGATVGRVAIESRTRSSSSTARPTSWRRTTARTRSTAASRVGQGRVGR